NATGFAYATALSVGTAGQGSGPSNFDRVLRRSLTQPTTVADVIYLLTQAGVMQQGSVSDDIAVVPKDALSAGRLFVTTPASSGTSQQLWSFDTTAVPPGPPTIADLGESVLTTVRLGYNAITRMIMATCLDSNRVRIASQDGTTKAQQIGSFAFPTGY